MGPTRQALRDATRDIHDRLDGAPLLRPLTAPGLTPDEYRTALIALHGFHAPVESRLGEDGRMALLRADLADLGMDAAALPVMDGLPDLSAPPARLAARYVLDGSAHGGRAMLPNVTAALGFDKDRGARFLAAAGAEVKAGWKALLDRLEAEISGNADRDRACATAVALFAALERWLERCPLYLDARGG